jgi:hypothetical protein
MMGVKMKALTYFINGNQCLTFMEDIEVEKMYQDLRNLNFQDFIERSFFFN